MAQQVLNYFLQFPSLILKADEINLGRVENGLR